MRPVRRALSTRNWARRLPAPWTHPGPWVDLLANRVKSLGVVFFRSGGDGGQGGAVAGAVVGLEHVGQVSQ